jgi:HEAT repeat protein
MRALAICLILGVAFAPIGWSICALPPPVEDPPPEDPPPPPPPPDGPTTPSRPNFRPNVRTGSRPSGPSYGASWRIWWELNREHMLGLRQTIRNNEVVSGGSTADGQRQAEEYRAKVRIALRQVADKATRASVRAAALRALGRAGNDEDARRFLRLLRKRQQPTEIYESAAIGLGTLPRIDDPVAKKELHKFFEDLLANKVWLTSSSRRLAILALSLRGRDDPMLAMKLAAHGSKVRGSASEMPTLLYACGLTKDPRVQSILLDGVKGAKLRGRRLGDEARGRAALGLSLSGDPAAVGVLSRVLSSRRVGVHTRRSAAIGLGMLMRSDKLSDEQRKRGEKALLRAFDRDRDPLVQGYAAMAMGTAHVPIGVALLRKAVDGGNQVVRPYAALALGLAADRAANGDKIRSFLHREFGRSKDIERTAALSIAVGMSGAKDAREDLFDCLRRKRLKVSVRAPAIQALGLLRQPTREIEDTLVTALDDKSNTVVEDASLALGFLGQRKTARLLVGKLKETKSESVQVHMVAAISHLGSNAAIDPLLKVLEGKKNKHTMRESAASALGILVDDREHDPLFEIDAHTNPYGLTIAGRALVLVY